MDRCEHTTSDTAHTYPSQLLKHPNPQVFTTVLDSHHNRTCHLSTLKQPKHPLLVIPTHLYGLLPPLLTRYTPNSPLGASTPL
jgi:hypothetical protein